MFSLVTYYLHNMIIHVTFFSVTYIYDLDIYVSFLIFLFAISLISLHGFFFYNANRLM